MAMFDSIRWVSRRPVASALVGVCALGVLLLVPATESAGRADLAGLARVIDGDTLVIAGARVRLEGIDAPEMAQTCGKPDEGSWDCGKAAAAALERLLADQRISCADRGTDS